MNIKMANICNDEPLQKEVIKQITTAMIGNQSKSKNKMKDPKVNQHQCRAHSKS
jgi:hypothetical protein